jgi:tRNA pseudouridine synthase 10
MNRFDPRSVEGVGSRILQAGPICDECLGRVASRLGTGLSNAERGRAIRDHLRAAGIEPRSGSCWVCQDTFQTLGEWARRAAEMARPFEFFSYLFGVVLPVRLEQMEALYRERFPSEHRESFKHSLNRCLGISFEKEIGDQVSVKFSDPHLLFVVDLASERVRMHVRSLYLYGRYRKLVRGIPQTRWPCRTCRGRGCPSCSFTGKQYPTSVEEIIGAPFVQEAQASSVTLHGAGREDIDARMVGQGRPFVLEVLSPKRRSLDLEQTRRQLHEAAEGRVEISPLVFVRRDAVKWVKEMKATKTYRARVELSSTVSDADLQRALSMLVGEIHQQTPQRVSHRRALRTRVRRLHEARGSLADERVAIIDLHGDGGLYIKELVSGDDGRTEPSLSSRLGVEATVLALDVLDVQAPDLPSRLELREELP